MKRNRREFIERVAASVVVYGLQPWKWAQWLYGGNTAYAIDAMRQWDEVGEAVAAVLPTTNTQTAPIKLGNAQLSAVSHGVNYGDATWNSSEETTLQWLRPATMTSTMLRVNTVAPGSITSAYRFDWPINIVGSTIRQFDLPLRILNTNNASGVSFNLLLSTSPTFTNYYVYGTNSLTFALTPRSNRARYMTALRHQPSSIVGSPNVTDTFTRLRLQVVVTAGSTVDVVIGPPLINAYATPLVSFSFDDTNLNDYTFAHVYMKSIGIKGSSCVNTSFGTLSHATMREMVQSGMWSIHNHTANHINLPAATVTQVDREIKQCRDILQTSGITTGKLFIPPFGETSDTVEDVVRQYYPYTVLAGGANFGFRSFDKFPDEEVIERVNVDSAVALSTMLTRLDGAVNFGNVINFFGHNPTPSPLILGHANSNDIQRLADVVARYHNAGLLESVTLEEAADRINGGRRFRYNG